MLFLTPCSYAFVYCTIYWRVPTHCITLPGRSSPPRPSAPRPRQGSIYDRLYNRGSRSGNASRRSSASSSSYRQRGRLAAQEVSGESSAHLILCAIDYQLLQK